MPGTLQYTNPLLGNWGGPVKDVQTVNDNATTPQEYQLTVSGENEVIPVVYGEVRLGIKIAAAKVHTDGFLHIIGVLCEGPVNSISSYQINNQAIATATSTASSTPVLGTDIFITAYTGSQTAAATASNGVAMTTIFGAGYADIMQGTAYLIIAVKPTAVQSLPQITALVQGKLVYDPRENRLLQSGTLNHASWTALGGVGLSQNAVDPDGIANKAWTMTDSSTTAYGGINQVLTVTSDATTVYALRVRVKKTTGGTAPTFGINYSLSGGTTQNRFLRLNTDTGLDTYGGGGWVIATDTASSAYWLCTNSVTNNGSGNTAVNVSLYAAVSSYGGTTDTVTATGTAVVCRPHLVYSSVNLPYIETTTAAITPTTAFSKNPSLCLGDFLANTTYGAGKSVDASSLAVCANANDSMITGTAGTEVSRQIGLVINNVASTQSWIDTLRLYASAFLFSAGSTVYMIPDTTTTTSATYGPHNIVAGSFAIRKEGVVSIPNYVEVQYTDTTTNPWRTGVVYDSNPSSITATGRRASAISLPGILRGSQAKREATQRLNGFMLCDLQVNFTAFDEAISSVIGDVIKVQHKYFDTVQDNYLLLDGTAGSFASTPDSVAQSPSGDAQFLCDIAANTYTPAASMVIMAKDPASNPRSFIVRITTGGLLELFSSRDGTSGSSIGSSVTISSLGINPGARVQFRIDYENSVSGNHRVTFYYKTNPLSVDWAQMGTAVSSAGTGGLYNSTATCTIGARGTPGTTEMFTGKIYGAQLYSGLGTTLNVNFDPNNTTQGATSFTASTTEVWTLGGNASISGPTGKLFRIQNITKPDLGRWQISAFEYNPSQYSTEVGSYSSTIPDTNNGNPLNIPTVTVSSAVEEIFRDQSGLFQSRIIANWSPPLVPGSTAIYTTRQGYMIRIQHIGGSYYGSDGTQTVSGSFATPITLETRFLDPNATSYTSIAMPGSYLNTADGSKITQIVSVAVAVVTDFGAGVGPYSTSITTANSVTLTGKLAAPSNVTGVSAYEAAGTCFISWQPANDADLEGYEIRYGTPGVSWGNATLLERLYGLTYKSQLIPPATWDILVKAFDSVGNYSDTEGRVNNVVVSEDSAAFTTNSRSFGYSVVNTTNCTNMQAFRLGSADTSQRYVSEDGTAFGTKFTASLSTYTASLATYHASMSSIWLPSSGDYLELGSNTSATWQNSTNYTSLAGTATAQAVTATVDISVDLTNWSQYAAGAPVKATGRYGRLQFATTGTGTLLVVCPTNSITISSVPREEFGSITSTSASATTVQLSNTYVTAVGLNLDPQGSTAAVITMWDNLKVSPFYVTDHLYLSANRTNTATTAYAVVQVCSTSLGQIVAGDKFLYDVYIDPVSPAFTMSGGIRGVVYSSATGGTVSGNLDTEVDQNSKAMLNADISSYATGQWYSRTFTLTTASAGQYLRDITLNIINSSPTAGSTGGMGIYKVYFKNIRLMDSTLTTTKGTCYASGNPSMSTASQVGCTSTTTTVLGNRFDIYTTDNAGTLVNGKVVYWRFKGI